MTTCQHWLPANCQCLLHGSLHSAANSCRAVCGCPQQTVQIALSKDANFYACLLKHSSSFARRCQLAPEAPVRLFCITSSTTTCHDLCCMLCTGRSGAYIGSPELGLVNYFQAKEIRRPNAPLARDAWACRSGQVD